MIKVTITTRTGTHSEVFENMSMAKEYVYGCAFGEDLVTKTEYEEVI